MELLISIGAGLIISALTGTVAWLLSGEIYRKRVVDAPTKFIKHLDALIKKAVDEGAENARINSRAIVGMRNSFRQHIISIAQLLNSEIDLLEANLSDGVVMKPIVVRAELRKSEEEHGISNEELYETIKVLEKTWLSKKDELNLSIRQIITMLGLDKA